MDILVGLLAFFLGLSCGSFIAQSAANVAKNHPIKLFERSACMSCGRHLKWFELIPVISYLILKGKCRNCEERIHNIYPQVELLTGILFLGSFFAIHWSTFLVPSFYPEMFIMMLLIIMTSYVSALDVMIRKFPITGIMIAFFLVLLTKGILGVEALSIALAGTGVFVLLMTLMLLLGYLIKKKPTVGSGDMFFALLLGSILGPSFSLAAWFIAVVSGALYGLIHLALGHFSREEEIPFAAFMGISSTIIYAATFPLLGM